MHFKEALINLTATKLRSLLAMLGILIGTGSVVAMVSSGELATQAAIAQFQALGTNMLAVSLYSQNNGATGDNANFDLSAALGLKDVSTSIRLVAPYIMLYAPVVFRGNSVNAYTIGATEILAAAINIHMKLGRFISDLDKQQNYCVIGYQIYQNLQPFLPNPIGRQIKLGNEIFTIIGVADTWPENSFFNQDINNTIIIPIDTAPLLGPYNSIDNIVFQLQDQASIAEVEAAVTRYINAKAPDKKLFFRSAKELVKSMAAQHRIFTLLLGLIGGISLLVGGVGVMNIMLVAVLERRREIGIRLALGARRRDIQWMFLSESTLLSVVGGILGISVGIISSFIIAEFVHWNFKIFLWPPVIGFTVSVLIGIFFGFYPARQAALLDPIQTLRAD